jgi:N6-adenosine-specific RNA methylase IME4
MLTQDIAALPVQTIVAKDATLFLWAIYPMLPEALTVLRAWGFIYRTVAFTWAKLNPSGVGWHLGLGYWSRANPEICLCGGADPFPISSSHPDATTLANRMRFASGSSASVATYRESSFLRARGHPAGQFGETK